jgi:hypothetical protein
MKAFYKGQIIRPYESFYRRASERFFHGTVGGQSRCVKCDDDLTILEVIYEQDSDSRILLEESAERSSL